MPAPDTTRARDDRPLDVIVAALEEDIVLGQLAPGTRLTEDELMLRFGCKRHVAREAFLRLALIGLIERPRNIGARVREFTPTEVIELYRMRTLLEVEAARRIPLPTDPVELARLVGIQAEHDAAIAGDNLQAVFRTNLAFHRQLFGMCGDSTLNEAIEEYARRTHGIRFGTLVDIDARRLARDEHHAMIAALRAGDRDSLVALCRRHLEPSRDAYLRAAGYPPEPVDEAPGPADAAPGRGNSSASNSSPARSSRL